MRDRDTRNPDNSVVGIHDERHTIALISWNLAINQQVLKFSTTRRAKWPDAIAGFAISNGEWQPKGPDL